MTDCLKISIVMPSLNQGAYVEDAVRSVLDQNYSDTELIVVDGGSTDGTLDILKRYSNRISHWESRPDRGQSEALNKGFRHVTGGIVGWLNSDDAYAPGTFQEVARVFGDDRVKVAMSERFGFMDPNGVIFAHKENRFTDHQTLVRFWATNGMTINQPSVFFRRELISDMDAVVDHNLHYAMDYDLWLRLSRDYPVSVVPGCWANYRIHEFSKTVEDPRKFVREWYAVSQRFWGARNSAGWWRLWFDHFYHWHVMRPLRSALLRLTGSRDGN